MFSNSNSFGPPPGDLTLARLLMWFPVMVWQPGPGKRR